jgi:hypothetical protein
MTVTKDKDPDDKSEEDESEEEKKKKKQQEEEAKEVKAELNGILKRSPSEYICPMYLSDIRLIISFQS